MPDSAGTTLGKSVVSNLHLCTMSIVCVLANDKMANISLDVRTFIAQNLPKYRFHSSLDYTFLSLSESSIIFQRKIGDICHIWIEKVAVVYDTLPPLSISVSTVYRNEANFFFETWKSCMPDTIDRTVRC